MIGVDAKPIEGVTAAVCCYNAAGRIEATLERLNFQQCPDSFSWELIIIDNASDDGTSQIAVDYWKKNSSVPLRVIREERQGLIYARQTAVCESSYECICFVDDDNWLFPDYLFAAYEIMNAKPSVGILGGIVYDSCACPPPNWFWQFLPSYAIGRQLPYGVVEGECEKLCGAGFVIRKQAWNQLFDSGVEFVSVGRSGKRLSAGDDTELCHALRLLGWTLYCSERLQLEHYITENRLQWSYYQKLVYGFGETSVAYIPYLTLLENSERSRSKIAVALRHYGIALIDALTVVRELLCVLLSQPGSNEAYQHKANIGFCLGRIKELIRQSHRLAGRIERLADAVRRCRRGHE